MRLLFIRYQLDLNVHVDWTAEAASTGSTEVLRLPEADVAEERFKVVGAELEVLARLFEAFVHSLCFVI